MKLDSKNCLLSSCERVSADWFCIFFSASRTTKENKTQATYSLTNFSWLKERPFKSNWEVTMNHFNLCLSVCLLLVQCFLLILSQKMACDDKLWQRSLAVFGPREGKSSIRMSNANYGDIFTRPLSFCNYTFWVVEVQNSTSSPFPWHALPLLLAFCLDYFSFKNPP